jgi:hypothetical protein
MEYLTYVIDTEHIARVQISVRNYKPTQLTDLLDTIQDIRDRSTSMTIKFDLTGVGLINFEQFQSISKLIMDVIEYTKNDNLLQRVEIVGAGFIFKWLYKPVSIAIPRQIRDMIVFV